VPEPRRVVAEREVEPRLHAPALTVTFDQSSGSAALEQRVLRFAPGESRELGPEEREEAMFVLEGRGTLALDGGPRELEPESSVAIGPGIRYRVENAGSEQLALVSVLVPPAGGGQRGATIRRLADQEARDATSDREFRILHAPESGLSGATQFVGYIPTKRAPEHYHLYDEVIYVLRGQGMLHIGDEHSPIGPGSCIHLSPELRHCLENTGGGEMRVLGVFRPAGDPSEAYLPDGTRAYVSEEDR
jgi:mannose-6-phosphate isomerase-like protein (cupin superfamily)